MAVNPQSIKLNNPDSNPPVLKSIKSKLSHSILGLTQILTTIYAISSATKQNNLKKNLTDYKKNFKQVYNKYIAARNDICEHGKMSKAKLAIARDSIVRELNDFIMLKSQEGINKAIKDKIAEMK